MPPKTIETKKRVLNDNNNDEKKIQPSVGKVMKVKKPKKEFEGVEFTMHGGSFLRILELFQKFVTDILIISTEEGLSVNTVSSDHTTLLNLKLEPDYFDTFKCTKNDNFG